MVRCKGMGRIETDYTDNCRITSARVHGTLRRAELIRQLSV